MALKIKNVTHGTRNYNRYCGPGAISALTGVTAERAAKLIAETRGITPTRMKAFAKNSQRTGRGFGIKGTAEHEMQHVLRKLGYNSVRIDPEDNYFTSNRLDVTQDNGLSPYAIARKIDAGHCRPTLKQWDDNRTRDTDAYLVVLSTHYVVVQGDKIVDNQLLTIRTLSEAKHYTRARVQTVYRITKQR